MRHTSVRTAVHLLTLLSLAACGGDGGTPPPDDTVTSVSVTPGNATLVSIGATQQLGATARTASGTTTATFTWASSDAAVATVDGSGLVTAVSEGTTTITASASGQNGTAMVTVAQAAATIALTVPNSELTAGSDVQATADVQDAGGTALATPALQWSSSDDGVATVDAEGLITGVEEGEATITASQDGVNGTVAVTVVRPTLNVDEDMSTSGDVIVQEMTVAAGVTLTLVGDTEIQSNGPITIEGTVVGDCTSLSIDGNDAVTISGVLQNSCDAAPDGGPEAPALTIAAAGGVDLDGATVTSSGPITVESSTAMPPRSPAMTTGLPTAATVSISGTTIRAVPAEAPQPANSNPGHGADITLRAAEISLNGSDVYAQHGAPGVPASETSASGLFVTGGAGGDGGSIIMEGSVFRFSDDRGPSTFNGGNGGPGGPANGTTTENSDGEAAPGVDATGGAGGDGGSLTWQDGFAVQGTSWDNFVVQPGSGGRGGNATAVAADGVDATPSRAAQEGGSASAEAGRGGRAGRASSPSFAPGDSRDGGAGGNASADSGDGGDGDVSSNPNGAAGGVAAAFGGHGGFGYRTLGGGGGSATALGGNGGDGAGACVAAEELSLSGTIAVSSDPASSDQYIFVAGAGINISLVRRLINLSGPGGDGGDGADLVYRSGRGGQRLDSESGERGPAGAGAVGPGGNGGDGGPGQTGGNGGLPGRDVPGENVEDPTVTGPSFQQGQAGSSCSTAATSSGPAVLFNRATRDIEITGNAPWVTVSGTWDDETGVVTAEGRGTVAGVPDILVEFSGSWDEETQTLTGTYTIDSEKVISSGHPVVYDITVTGG